jgi:hypothetical protein
MSIKNSNDTIGIFFYNESLFTLYWTSYIDPPSPTLDCLRLPLWLTPVLFLPLWLLQELRGRVVTVTLSLLLRGVLLPLHCHFYCVACCYSYTVTSIAWACCYSYTVTSIAWGCCYFTTGSTMAWGVVTVTLSLLLRGVLLQLHCHFYCVACCYRYTVTSIAWRVVTVTL